MNYIIRNDVSHVWWEADKAEARLYAIGGLLDSAYSVFEKGGNGSCVCVFEL